MSASLVRGHLSEAALQSLADGTLRGPEGYKAREHCDACADCAAGVAELEALLGKLELLRDPLPPVEFTSAVLAAASARELQVRSGHQIRLAAIPAALVAAVAILGWTFSEGVVQRLADLRASLALARTVLDVVAPVVSAARVPLAMAAFAACLVLMALLSRALRPVPSRTLEA